MNKSSNFVSVKIAYISLNHELIPLKPVVCFLYSWFTTKAILKNDYKIIGKKFKNNDDLLYFLIIFLINIKIDHPKIF